VKHTKLSSRGQCVVRDQFSASWAEGRLRSKRPEAIRLERSFVEQSARESCFAVGFRVFASLWDRANRDASRCG
jgi:hypothetical protein